MRKPNELELKLELRRVHRSRFRFAYSIQLLFLAVSLWIQTNFLQGLSFGILALGLAGFVTCLLATEILDPNLRSSRFLSRMGIFLLSLAWVVHVGQTLSIHTDQGETVPILRVMVGILVLANSAFLVADVLASYVFIVPMALGIFVEVFVLQWTTSVVPLISFLTIAVISSLGLYFQNRQLREFILAKLDAIRERKRLKKIIDGVPGFVAIADAEGTYVDANAYSDEFFPTLVGKKIGSHTPDSSYQSFAWEFLQSKKDSAYAETDALIRGERVYLLTTLARLDDGGMISINIPITELVNTRKELRAKEVQAEYSAKLASVGQMAAGVAHEVNNPLAIIQGAAKIISGLVDEDPIDKKNLKLFSERIVNTTDRIAQIVRSLRSLTRGGDQDPFTPLSLKSLVSSCADLSGLKLREFAVELELPKNKKDMKVLGREVQLGQVLLNLISNSIDAIKDLPERWVKIDYGHQDGEVWLEVSDSGKGIPAEVVEKMMEPFFTTKRDEGTGLGLPISSKIIDEHGGKLTYLSERPNTTFRLKFPSPKISL